MKSLCLVRASVVLLAVVCSQLSAVAQTDAAPAQSPKLYCGTDATGFEGENGQLAVVRTDGPAIVGTVQLFNLTVPLNGITFDNTFLWAGQPEQVGSVVGNTLRKISVTLPPTVLATIPPGSDSFNAACCSEQMVVFKGQLYHAHYDDVIQQLTVDSSGNSEVTATYAQTDVVGMASDGAKIWISKWSEEQVGTWDPTTNIFTPVFSTPNSAGALAWDLTNHVLWVGMTDGSVIPYSSTGKQLGNGFQPFGSISNTIDGLAFVPVGGTASETTKRP
jgi:hypothetical protein